MPRSRPDAEPPGPPRIDAAVLWRAHRAWLAAVVVAHMPREAELEDLLQDVAVAITTGVQSGRVPDDTSAVPAWLRAIALNTARTTMRKAYRRRRRDAQARAFAVEAGFEPTARDDFDRLRALVGRLPAHAREPLLLQVVHGLSVRDIANVMELPERTVETRLVRARRDLRAALREPDVISRSQA